MSRFIRTLSFIAILCFVIGISNLGLTQVKYPQYSGYVNDYAMLENGEILTYFSISWLIGGGFYDKKTGKEVMRIKAIVIFVIETSLLYYEIELFSQE